MKQGFIIPIYRHGSTLAAVIQSLPQQFPVLLIDDGNDDENKNFIADAVRRFPQAVLVSLPVNCGKGKAVCTGIIKAHDMGLTHILQVDADGQHDTGRCASFFEESSRHPEAIICGYPEYDESVPAARKNGRRFGNMWTQIVAFNTDFKDSMCGFRVYPVEPFYALIQKHAVDARMGFDTEILVKLIWAGVPVIPSPVHVTYPAGGTSNFRMVRDNIRISWMFTRLCCGMLIRLPVLVPRAVQKAAQERNNNDR